MNTIIVNGEVCTPGRIIGRGFVAVSGNKIVGIGEGSPGSEFLEFNRIDASGKMVMPGFIDIHVNGGGGSLAVEGTIEALRNICRAHARFGTTGLLATTITVEDDALKKTVLSVKQAIERGSISSGAKLLGMHLEGPFLNPAKAGAHKKELLRTPDKTYLEQLFRLSGDNIKIVSLAPELEGGLELVDFVKANNVIPSLAHSDADFSTTRDAIARGMVLCSHLFNAMPPFNHRTPGPIGAFLASHGSYVELIADGYHVHPAAMEIAIRSKGASEVIIVTDAVTPAGTDLKSFSILGTNLEVRGKSCFTPDGGLAGSALTMNTAVKVIAEQTDTALLDAISMASINPARLLGLDHSKGSVSVGKDADLLIANRSLEVFMTMVEGDVVYLQQ